MRRVALVLIAALVLPVASFAAAPAGGGTPAPQSEIPDTLKAELIAAVSEKASKLAEEKNEDGVPFKRGTYSKHFTKIDDTTYQTTFHRDTASKETVLTERFLVTLKLDPSSNKWKVDKEELQDSYTGLFRGIFNEGNIAHFGSFLLNREGMKVTGSKGSLHTSYLQGKLWRILVATNDLAYEYTPPAKLASLLYDKLKKDRESDVLFKPDYVEITCDPVTCEEILTTSFTGLTRDLVHPPTHEGGAGPEARSGSPLDEVDPALRKRIQQEEKEVKKALREDGFAFFRRLPEPDRRGYFIDLRKDTPDHRVGLGYDSWEPKEVEFWAYGLEKLVAFYAPVFTYYSQATIEARDKGVITAYDLEKRDDPGARFYDLTGLKGTVEMGIEDSEKLSADVTFKLTAKRDLRDLFFFIDSIRETEDEKKQAKKPNMTINAIEDADGHPLTWVKTGPTSGLVVFPKQVSTGSPVTVRLEFETSGVIYHLTPTYSYVDRGGWLPFVRFTDPIADFDLTVKVPARFTTLGIGRKAEERVENGISITRWVADSPVEFPSVIYGEYIHAESDVIAKKKDGTKIPVNIYTDKSGKITWAEKALKRLADQAAMSLNLYTAIYDEDYPYAKLDLVGDPFGPLFYGQSPSSLIYLGSGVFLGEGATGGILESGYLSKFNNEVVPHEVGHQWWGSLIPNFNVYNYWFVESLAEYSSALFVEAEASAAGGLEAGQKAYQKKVEEWRQEILDSDLKCSVQDAIIVWPGNIFRGYRAAVYAKGPYMFHIMRKTWGEDKFFQFLKTMTHDLKGRPIITRDIQREAEKVYGGNMEFFFDQWIRGVGEPEFTMTYKVKQTEDGKYLVEGTIDQRIVVGRQKDLLEGVNYRAVIPITIVNRDGKEGQQRILIEKQSQPFQFKVADRPKEIIFNKYGEALAYDVLVKEAS